MSDETFRGRRNARLLMGSVALGWIGLLLLALRGVIGAQPDDFLPFGAMSLLFTGLGAVILARVPGNRVGWVVAAPGVTVLASGVAQALTDQGVDALRGLSAALYFSTFAALGFLMLWFPTGEPPTPRWRWVGWLGFLAVAVIVLLSLFSERHCVEGGEGRCLRYVDNPIGVTGIPDGEYDAAAVTLPLLIAFLALAALSAIVRFVRSRGVERLQLKWFSFSVSLLVSSIVLVESTRSLTGVSIDDSPVWDAIFLVLLLGVPVSAVVAVTRYRLYEIDRIVSRTVSYTVVVGLLAGVYAVVWVVASEWLPLDSDLAVASATLAAAALFTPVRRRVQRMVDRRFNRSRYEADRVVEEFGGRLREGADLEMIPRHLEAVIRDTLQPSVVGVWIRNPGT